MAFSNQIMALALVLFLVLALPSALAEVICENLPINQCAFAVSSTSNRCVLESTRQKGGTMYQCKTTDLNVGLWNSNHIETEDCVRTCGLEDKTVGILSLDFWMDSRNLQKLCSLSCKKNCKTLSEIVSTYDQYFPSCAFSEN